MPHKSFINLLAFILYLVSKDTVSFWRHSRGWKGNTVNDAAAREEAFFVLYWCSQHIFLVLKEIHSNSEFLPRLFNPPSFYVTISDSLFSSLSLSLCRKPMCRIVTAKLLAFCRTRWAETVVPPCSFVVLPLATMMQRLNPPWCLANGNYTSMLSSHGLHGLDNTALLQLLGCFSADVFRSQILFGCAAVYLC